MKFKLRDQEYEIVNSSNTLLSKVSVALKNKMASPDDDAAVAYAITRACPSIAPQLVSWEGGANFSMALDLWEVSAFGISLNIAFLERTPTKNVKDQKLVQDKVKQLKDVLLHNMDGNLTTDQVKMLSDEVKAITKEVAIQAGNEPLEIQAISVNATPLEDKTDTVSLKGESEPEVSGMSREQLIEELAKRE